jgi:hypothetical protein
MPHETLLTQIAEWHEARENGKIHDAILALPENERTDELVCLLARALNNEDDFSGALTALDGIRETRADDPYYCFLRGFALYRLHQEHEALPWFKKARESGLEDIGEEMPDNYLPKSVSKWIERAEEWGPRREEINAFETKRRAARNKEPRKADFTDADFEGLWDDCDYSTENYVGRPPTDEDIAAAEAELGYRLPDSYKALMKRHNGGMLERNSFENPLRREWTVGVFSVDSIFGLDHEKSYSLCGEMGSRFWIKEWGYPDIGVVIGDTMSGGHDMIFLDYSDCGREGEPCVVQIDQESDYEITYLADDFASFVRGLTPFYDEDE